jgi:hypothetical protein
MLTPEEVHITFFDIKKCGFYKARDRSPMFGGVDDILTQVQQWSTALDLSQTKLIDAATDTDEDPVYLFGLKKKAASWLVATWNEVPSSVSGVASVSMNSKVGDAKVHLNGVVANSIPGYATYFWIIPGRSLLATVKFSNKSGQPGFAAYLGTFMSRYCRYVVLENRNGIDAVAGYTNTSDRKVITNIAPQFKTKLYHKPSVIKFFTDNVATIRRVLRRGHLSSASTVDTSLWQNFIKFVHGQPNRANVTDQRVYLELDYRPTAAELIQMIEAENQLQHRGYDDLGFMFDGDSKEHWLSGSRAAGVISLNVKRINEAAVDIESLLLALQDNESEILKFLQ